VGAVGGDARLHVRPGSRASGGHLAHTTAVGVGHIDKGATLKIEVTPGGRGSGRGDWYGHGETGDEKQKSPKRALHLDLLPYIAAGDPLGITPSSCLRPY